MVVLEIHIFITTTEHFRLHPQAAAGMVCFSRGGSGGPSRGGGSGFRFAALG
ncbi:hypothetical protein O977_00270 [Mycobacterium avium subsp. paratuberculosis 10-5975]|nr:hypothetical protein O977_00270 [Mycobacterium avium subsp. paratuberculosis 10-5975]